MGNNCFSTDSNKTICSDIPVVYSTRVQYKCIFMNLFELGWLFDGMTIKCASYRQIIEAKINLSEIDKILLYRSLIFSNSGRVAASSSFLVLNQNTPVTNRVNWFPLTNRFLDKDLNKQILIIIIYGLLNMVFHEYVWY